MLFRVAARATDDEIAPVILSVGEDEEISIKDVATSIARHIGYEGGLEARPPPFGLLTPTQSPPPPPKTEEIADSAAILFSFIFSPQFDATKADGQHRKPASNVKLLKLINKEGEQEFKFTPFDEAMGESVKWFLDNYECVSLPLSLGPSDLVLMLTLLLTSRRTARTGNPAESK